MKRWLAKATIACYLTALSVGIVCHAMNFGLSSSTVMYYFVWDMFCGWTAHEIRYHIVAEGESGKYYSLSPAPWNTFAPYGDLERAQYDTFGKAQPAMARNTLLHSDHEPIVRIMVVEEAWPKKFNLPESLWSIRFDEPKDPHSYFSVKMVMNGEGDVLRVNSDYLTNRLSETIADNPRLRADSRRGKPFFAVDPSMRTNALIEAASPVNPFGALTAPDTSSESGYLTELSPSAN